MRFFLVSRVFTILSKNPHSTTTSRKVVVFGQKWLYSGKSGCIQARWLYSGKMVVFG